MEKWEFDDGASYEGETEGEFMHGHGKYTFPSGSYYIGEFKYNKFDGYGLRLDSAENIYVGSFKDDKYDGYGKIIYKDSSTFAGQFYEGRRNGKGVFINPKGIKYIGYYEDNKRNGYGAIVFPSGTTKVVFYQENKIQDEIVVSSNGTIRINDFDESEEDEDVEIIKGIIDFGTTCYVGEIDEKGVNPDGHGIIERVKLDKTIIEGTFKNGNIEHEYYKIKLLNHDSKSFFADFESDSSEIFYLDDYHPYRKGENPDFNEFSEQILNLKRNSDRIGLRYFSRKLKDYFNPHLEFVIVIVPSHNPQKTESGIKRLAQALADQNENITDGTECLVRTDLIEKLSHGGDRDISVHLESMEVKNIRKIRNKYVLLFDDVTTTNNSLLAGQQLLLDAGAKVVQPFALGQTY